MRCEGERVARMRTISHGRTFFRRIYYFVILNFATCGAGGSVAARSFRNPGVAKSSLASAGHFSFGLLGKGTCT